MEGDGRGRVVKGGESGGRTIKSRVPTLPLELSRNRSRVEAYYEIPFSFPPG